MKLKGKGACGSTAFCAWCLGIAAVRETSHRSGGTPRSVASGGWEGFPGKWRAGAALTGSWTRTATCAQQEMCEISGKTAVLLGKVRSRLGLWKGFSKARTGGSFSGRAWAPVAVLRTSWQCCVRTLGASSARQRWQERTGRLL